MRLARGVSQQTMSTRLGVSQPYLSMHENEHGGWGLPRGFAAAYEAALEGCSEPETTA